MPLAERALVMVWDGMRPDLVSPELTPNLIRLTATGVRFLDSHAVFPTVTRANSASLSTGALPAGHGIIGNSLYAPLVDPRAPISIGDHRSLYLLIETLGGRLLPCDTLADRIALAGGRTVVVSSGTPGSALLCHPRVRESPDDRLFHPAFVLPEHASDELTRRFGPLPSPAIPNSTQNAYFTRAIVDYVLPELDPRLLIYWHNDPDKTQHNRGFGSPQALLAIHDADANLGTLLDALEAGGRLDQTVVAVISDHGYASLDRVVNSTEPFVQGGLRDELERGRLIVSKNGLSLFVNVPDGDAALVERVVEAFVGWQHTGVLFSGARGAAPIEGTLPLAIAGLDGELAPDVLCAMAWNDGPNRYGHAGRATGFDTGYSATHGGISPWEIRNTFVLAGPGVKAGHELSLPAGNLDLTPTMLHLLGLERPRVPATGRVLVEALVDGPNPATIEVKRETVRASRGTYRQSVQFSMVDGARYLDYGERDSVDPASTP
jgi:arylsulfatase A-like enzyme